MAQKEILYAFVVDPKSPVFLSTGCIIFNATEGKDFIVKERSYAKLDSEYSDSETTASQHIASQFGVEGSYGAFSGAASMAIDSQKKSSVKTVRMDVSAICQTHIVQSDSTFRTRPENFLTKSFRDDVKQLSCEEIEAKIGVFYATSFKLGGRVSKVYVKEATEDDDEKSLENEIELTYGKGPFAVTGKTKASISTSKSNKNAKMRTSWSAMGGDTKVWLKMDSSNSNPDPDAILQEWVATFSSDGSNAFPCDFQLQPLWGLISHVDKEKGNEYQKYLEAKWAESVSAQSPTQFIKSNKICNHKNAKTWIKQCDDHRAWASAQKTEAQSYIDTFMTNIRDKSRNENWRRAAQNGVDQANQLKKDITSDMSEDEFKEMLEVLRLKRKDASEKNWGVNGHDSVKSNEVEKGNLSMIVKIQNSI